MYVLSCMCIKLYKLYSIYINFMHKALTANPDHLHSTSNPDHSQSNHVIIVQHFIKLVYIFRVDLIILFRSEEHIKQG